MSRFLEPANNDLIFTLESHEFWGSGSQITKAQNVEKLVQAFAMPSHWLVNIFDVGGLIEISMPSML